MVESDWARPRLSGVLASDASLSGYAVTQSFWNPSDVASVGRVPRRCRCRAVPARRHAFESTGLRACFGRPFSLDPELAKIIASERWETDPHFPEVHILSSHSWKKVIADRWFFDDDILRLEALALVKAAERSAHSQRVHDRKILSLSDDISVVLCFNRGRSHNFRLLTHIKRFASVCLARNIRISIRWIPSEFNSSDSREHDSAHDATKSLVDHLGSGETTVEVCEVDGTSAAVLTLIMFETGTVRRITGEVDVTTDLVSDP